MMTQKHPPINKQKAIEVVDGVIQLIAKGWTQGVAARNKDGQPVSAKGQEATCWCIQGALDATCDKLLPGDGESYTWLVYQVMYTSVIQNRTVHTSFNDLPTTGQQDVLAFLRRVRSRLETELI